MSKLTEFDLGLRLFFTAFMVWVVFFGGEKALSDYCVRKEMEQQGLTWDPPYDGTTASAHQGPAQ